MAGYSATPLINKLGIKPGMKIFLADAPSAYFDWLGANISDQVVKSGKTADIVHIFAKSRKELEKQFHAIIKDIHPDGVIWVSWYKQSAGIPTDITEDAIREVVLPAGWVDVKVCAVNEEWSGLKIVKRKELR